MSDPMFEYYLVTIRFSYKDGSNDELVFAEEFTKDSECNLLKEMIQSKVLEYPHINKAETVGIINMSQISESMYKQWQIF